MILLLNPKAGGNTAAEKWRRFVAASPRLEEEVHVHFLQEKKDMPALVNEAASRGELHYVAAGGDGTVHDLLNALMQLPLALRKNAILGAIGLGSSNDFHKPFEKGRMVGGVPYQIAFDHASPRDIGVAIVRNDGVQNTIYFCINASIGITAQGNALFNRPDRPLAWLKSHSTRSAILYAALNAIITYPNTPMIVELPSGEHAPLSLTNLGIVKNPNFSGSLRYDVPSRYDDGLFHVCVATSMGFLNRLHLLWSLTRGVFTGIPNTVSWTTPSLTVESPSPFAVELDGEIMSATKVEFSIIPSGLKVCP